MNQDEIQRINRRAAWRWGSFVMGLLGLQVAGGLIAILLATGDKSVAVVPNYHAKALNWDEEVATRAASASLGWNCEVRQTPPGTLPAGLRLTLHDREGLPVRIRSGEVWFYQHTRASEIKRVAVVGGLFNGLELQHCFKEFGLWQVHVDVQGIHDERFVDSQTLMVEPLDGHAAVWKPF